MRQEGFGLYKGVILTFPHSFLPTGIYIYIYEHLLHITYDLVDKYTKHKEVKLIFPFFMSVIAEVVAMIIELPFDTVRTRIQVSLL